MLGRAAAAGRPPTPECSCLLPAFAATSPADGFSPVLLEIQDTLKQPPPAVKTMRGAINIGEGAAGRWGRAGARLLVCLGRDMPLHPNCLPTSSRPVAAQLAHHKLAPRLQCLLPDPPLPLPCPCMLQASRSPSASTCPFRSPATLRWATACRPSSSMATLVRHIGTTCKPPPAIVLAACGCCTHVSCSATGTSAFVLLPHHHPAEKQICAQSNMCLPAAMLQRLPSG